MCLLVSLPVVVAPREQPVEAERLRQTNTQHGEQKHTGVTCHTPNHADAHVSCYMQCPCVKASRCWLVMSCRVLLFPSLMRFSVLSECMLHFLACRGGKRSTVRIMRRNALQRVHVDDMCICA